MKEIDQGILIQSADYWRKRWEETGLEQDLVFYREAEDAWKKSLVPSTDWKADWHQDHDQEAEVY